jgi:hypothetical protein
VLGAFVGFVVGSALSGLVRLFFAEGSRSADGCIMGGIFGACFAMIGVVGFRHVWMMIAVRLVAGVGGFVCGWLARDLPSEGGWWW